MPDKTEKITIKAKNRGVGLTLRPAVEVVDLSSSPVLGKKLKPFLKKPVPFVVVDLREVKNIDTSGLATLVDFAGNLREKGTGVAVFGLAEDAADQLPFNQVREVLNFSVDLQEAVEQAKTESENLKTNN